MPLNPNETIAEVVTVSGWYRTSEGRYAEVLWNAGRTRISRVESQIPSREEDAARIERDLSEQGSER